MFCIQCEQTVRTSESSGCQSQKGVCGKTAETSDLQDLLITVLAGLSGWIIEGKAQQLETENAQRFIPFALFSTLTNVNFDPERIVSFAIQATQLRDELAKQLGKNIDHPLANLSLKGNDVATLSKQASNFSFNATGHINKDTLGLQLLNLYGLKGAAAYYEHAQALGQFSDELSFEIVKHLAWLGSTPTNDNELLDNAMAIGQLNFKIMQLLELAETNSFGHPIPTEVNRKPTKGKAILVSGHDLNDLKLLLEQTEGTGINVYTHGELLPAHGYPLLKQYTHLKGNYGGAWQMQQREFMRFPGPILMTSNCIIDPTLGAYQDRIWTRSMVGWPGVKHITDDNFSPIIEQAKTMIGFTQTEIEESITVGFGRETLLGASDSLLSMFGDKSLRHAFLVGGCDGRSVGRDYYSEFTQSVPKDCVVLTLGCAKYRFNDQAFGDINGLPRLIDIGQCNDSFAAIMLAVNLAEKLGCSVNDLPLSIVLSWFEQKAIVVLLTLLSLGVKNIYTGPQMPAFLTPNLLKILTHQYGIKAISDVESDMKKMLVA
ncbi:hydroxylamine reductase [Thorsellia anophelis]|uniref:Hydroxylamine reductase n=1 Tax=Thorsellia anophelis DSM 18579 TaxID=1123402 RepID=A0A1I0DSE5_9GAMM|nr:hydroxylamine reductase [Thorsellia anophelis]SET35224.1 hydroxylamine reductase precursor [Thorsellia anophelis DSM 18579]